MRNRSETLVGVVPIGFGINDVIHKIRARRRCAKDPESRQRMLNAEAVINDSC
jgi:hypothetical protein